MNYEAEFYFEQQLHPEVVNFESSCPTAALNYARGLAKQARAEHFNVSLPVVRNADGQIELRSENRKRAA